MSRTASSGSNRPSVALVTSREFPRLTDDDRSAASALEARGVRAVPALWDAAHVDWLEFGAVVLRSTWDYHRRLPEFLAWIDRLEQTGARLWNPPAAVRWNCRKSYLLDIVDGPLRPPPTTLLTAGDVVHVPRLFDQLGSNVLVAKAAVSLDANDTELVDRTDGAHADGTIDRLRGKGDVIVQPLVSDITTRGELSLMFLGGAFSHAVRKRPRRGEYRVQERLGGTNEPAVPASSLVEDAAVLLARLGVAWLYARVDVVETTERPVLMEVELIEPSLFLGADPSSAGRFAAAVLRVLP